MIKIHRQQNVPKSGEKKSFKIPFFLAGCASAECGFITEKRFVFKSPTNKNKNKYSDVVSTGGVHSTQKRLMLYGKFCVFIYFWLFVYCAFKE